MLLIYCCLDINVYHEHSSVYICMDTLQQNRHFSKAVRKTNLLPHKNTCNTLNAYFNEFIVLCLCQAVRQVTVIYNSQSSSPHRMMKDGFSSLCQQSFFSSLLLFSVHCLPLASSVTRQHSLQTLSWLAENKLFSQWCEIYQTPTKLHLETSIQALVWGWSIVWITFYL